MINKINSAAKHLNKWLLACSLLILLFNSSHLFAGHPSVFAPAGYSKPAKLSQFSLKANRDHHGRKIYHTAELVVLFKNNVTTSSRNQIIAQYASHTHKVFGKNKRYKLIRLKPGQTLQQAMARFKSDPNVENVEYNYYTYPSGTPNDTRYVAGDQWGLNNTGQTINGVIGTPNADIKAHSAWSISGASNCSTITVAVLDTGIHYDHPDLVNNMVTTNMRDYIDGDNDPKPGVNTGASETHGTHVSGIIGAQGNNGTGVSGVCWSVKILPIRILTSSGGSGADLVLGIDHAIANNVNVINLSLGLNGNSTSVSDALDRARTAGIVVVVAAGNDGVNVDTASSGFIYPCKYTHANLVCVAALDNTFALATFSAPDVGSNTGTTSVDVGAPGKFIIGTTSATGYGYYSGTSQASPHVAGIAAMLLAYNYPNFTYTDVVNAIKNGGTDETALNGTTLTGKAVSAIGSLQYVNTPRNVTATVP